MTKPYILHPFICLHAYIFTDLLGRLHNNFTCIYLYRHCSSAYIFTDIVQVHISLQTLFKCIYLYRHCSSAYIFTDIVHVHTSLQILFTCIYLYRYCSRAYIFMNHLGSLNNDSLSIINPNVSKFLHTRIYKSSQTFLAASTTTPSPEH